MSERARGPAPKAAPTSDVARPRTFALAAAGAAVGVTVALVAQGTPASTPRPIARPHAKLACTSCHVDPATPAAVAPDSCATCHGTNHGSTRPAHRALAARGELGCPTCHAQHAGAQGVSFAADGIVRWGAGAEMPVAKDAGSAARGTTVPLVALARCARCHDPSRAADPIAACVPASARVADGGVALSTTPAQCFDEHVKVDAHRGDARAACKAQHTDDRAFAWEAAREIAVTTPWVAAPKHEELPWAPAVGALAGGVGLALVGAAAERRRRRGTVTPKTPAPAERRRLPTIDPSTCLGCYACVDACPFDVLAVEKYVAVVVRPEECCGVVSCQQVCPNGSLRVEDGEPILDRPATNDELESRDVPGLFLAGDLTGLPLIKNAINQGVKAVDRIAATLPRRRDVDVDVLVIGAGPAGLAAALRAKEKRLSCVVLEQATVAASIKSFPRDKIVHDPPLDLPVEGELWLKEASKEELLAQWTRIVRARALDVREGHRVVDLVKEETGFVVTVEQGATFRAARVILAIGRRGTPRRLDLDVEAGTEHRIAYALADARSFAGRRVVIAGLGDTAIEAALALARQPGTSVTLVYRGAAFARGKARNVAEVQAAVAERRIELLFETVPVGTTKAGVVVAGPGGARRTLPADALFVLIGGVPAWDLLTRAGIRRPERKEEPAGTFGGEPSAAWDVGAPR